MAARNGQDGHDSGEAMRKHLEEQLSQELGWDAFTVEAMRSVPLWNKCLALMQEREKMREIITEVVHDAEIIECDCSECHQLTDSHSEMCKIGRLKDFLEATR